jgi:hypothetical protein
MDHSEELFDVESKSGKRAAPRKWREIEALNERRRLQRELMDIDEDFDLDELDF